MLWTSHHLLFDGWSLPVMMEEFLTTYEQLITGQTLPEVAEDRYEDYIRYLEQQDKQRAESYWRDQLSGIDQGTLVAVYREQRQGATKGSRQVCNSAPGAR